MDDPLEAYHDALSADAKSRAVSNGNPDAVLDMLPNRKMNINAGVTLPWNDRSAASPSDIPTRPVRYPRAGVSVGGHHARSATHACKNHDIKHDELNMNISFNPLILPETIRGRCDDVIVDGVGGHEVAMSEYSMDMDWRRYQAELVNWHRNHE